MILGVPVACTTFQYDFFFLKETTDIEALMASSNNGRGYYDGVINRLGVIRNFEGPKTRVKIAKKSVFSQQQ